MNNCREVGTSNKKPHVQEFSIRVPKTQRKKHHVMRFNATLNVDFAQWKTVKLERENNMKEYKNLEEEQPKFGAGSEYNRDLREEARKKKFGIISKKYRADQQPWILKVGGKSGKKFKGIREGGVGENASFYVFTHAPDGTIEAYPLNEWYNFQPINRYKSLTAEEAEQEFGRRKKVMNFFSLMLRKRLKGDETEEIVEEESKSKMTGKKSKELKISDMDEWIEDSDSESDSDNGNEKKASKNDDSDDDGGKAKNKKDSQGKKEKKKKRDLDDEAFEESDDGDEEGREMDYDTESSEDVPDPEDKINKELKSVAEEDALRKLLSSDEDEEDENKSDNESDREKNKDKEDFKDKKKSKKSKPVRKDSSSDSYIDSSDSENEPSKKKSIVKDSSSRSVTPTTVSSESNKRKIVNMPTDLNASDNSNSPVSTPAKKIKTDSSLPSSFSGVINSNVKDDTGITEEAVRRYLMRKPMTATELLTKFKNKKTGLSSERLVETMTQILKRISPTKQTIQGKMYLSISQK